jgi:hypothetical protein
LAELAAVVRERFDELGRDVEALRAIIADMETALGKASAAPRDGDESVAEARASNGTPDPEAAQAEVVSK